MWQSDKNWHITKPFWCVSECSVVDRSKRLGCFICKDLKSWVLHLHNFLRLIQNVSVILAYFIWKDCVSCRLGNDSNQKTNINKSGPDLNMGVKWLKLKGYNKAVKFKKRKQRVGKSRKIIENFKIQCAGHSDKIWRRIDILWPLCSGHQFSTRKYNHG